MQGSNRLSHSELRVGGRAGGSWGRRREGRGDDSLYPHVTVSHTGHHTARFYLAKGSNPPTGDNPQRELTNAGRRLTSRGQVRRRIVLECVDKKHIHPLPTPRHPKAAPPPSLSFPSHSAASVGFVCMDAQRARPV